MILSFCFSVFLSSSCLSLCLFVCLLYSLWTFSCVSLFPYLSICFAPTDCSSYLYAFTLLALRLAGISIRSNAALWTCLPTRLLSHSVRHSVTVFLWFVLLTQKYGFAKKILFHSTKFVLFVCLSVTLLVNCLASVCSCFYALALRPAGMCFYKEKQDLYVHGTYIRWKLRHRCARTVWIGNLICLPHLFRL